VLKKNSVIGEINSTDSPMVHASIQQGISWMSKDFEPAYIKFYDKMQPRKSVWKNLGQKDTLEAKN